MASAGDGPIAEYLAELDRRTRAMPGGEVATYIPELAKADPNHFGVAIAMADGRTYAAGDCDVAFTIQSVSKPFLYGFVLQELGRDRVLRHVGVEPTGQAFNSTVLDEENSRPFNPMVNAGAIAVSALVQGGDYAARRRTVVEVFSRFAGRALTIDEAVFESERETGDRNRAIAALMRQASMLEGDTEAILDLYFSQCSVLVTCRDLAVMAATLANGGVNPVTGERALAEEYVHDVLTVMNSCGMYNYAGQWSYEVGIPAKSGVAGSIAAAAPGQAGIAAFSPPLDRFGNSVRAIAACKQIAADFGLHAFRTRPGGAPAIRSEARGDAMRSKRRRTAQERDVLNAHGRRIAVLEAQGALHFGAAEMLTRRLGALLEDADFVIADMRRVFAADRAACAMLQRLAEGDARLMFAHAGPEGPLAALHAATPAARFHATRDAALEYCEDRVIAGHPGQAAPPHWALREIDLFRDVDEADLDALEGAARAFSFEAGQHIVREGEHGALFFAIASGEASVRLRLPGEPGRSVRLATVGPGGVVGEMALLDGAPRSADVVADERVLAYGFSIDELTALGETRPRLLAAILINLSRDLADRLRAANGEIRSLEA